MPKRIRKSLLTPEERIEHAEIWLGQAFADQVQAKRILMPCLWLSRWYRPRAPQVPVYLLQQAVEKAAKALMVAEGYSEDDLRKYRHNSLWIILNHIRIKCTEPNFRKIADAVYNHQLPGSNIDEIIQTTDTLIRRIRSSEARELAVLPSSDIGGMIRSVVLQHKQVKTEASRLLRSRASVTFDPEKFTASSEVDYIIELAMAFMQEERISSHARETVKNWIDPEALRQVLGQASKSRLELSRHKLISEAIIPQFWTLPALYVLAALTFPHEASSRYPAPLGTTADAIEASKKGKMGIQHYTEALGIVSQLHQLHKLTELVLHNLRLLLKHRKLILNRFPPHITNLVPG